MQAIVEDFLADVPVGPVVQFPDLIGSEVAGMGGLLCRGISRKVFVGDDELLALLVQVDQQLLEGHLLLEDLGVEQAGEVLKEIVLKQVEVVVYRKVLGIHWKNGE